MRHRLPRSTVILCRAIGLDLSRGSDNDVSGDMKCPAGQTIKIGTLDAAQNPSCVKCGGHLQFACSEFSALLSCNRATHAWPTSSCALLHCTASSNAPCVDMQLDHSIMAAVCALHMLWRQMRTLYQRRMDQMAAPGSRVTASTLPADGSTCKKGLRVLDTASCVQPLCIPDGARLP
jgi:hypothetical protein